MAALREIKCHPVFTGTLAGVRVRNYESSSLYLWCCHISTDKGNGRRTDSKNAKKCLSGDGSRRGSCKERIRTEQVTDKERSTSVSVTDV